MTGQARGLVSALFDPEAQREGTAERERRLQECGVLLLTSYFQVLVKLNGDRATAADLFGLVAKTAKKFSPRKSKGPHDPDFDKALLAAYDTAPKRQKTAQVAAVGEAHGHRDPETTIRHLRRLLRARKQQEPPIEKIAAALHRGDTAQARGLLMEWVEQQNWYRHL
jgi:hypothetical protein